MHFISLGPLGTNRNWNNTEKKKLIEHTRQISFEPVAPLDRENRKVFHVLHTWILVEATNIIYIYLWKK